MPMIVGDLQLGYSQEIKMNNNETYDKVVEGMCLTSYNNINSTFNWNSVWYIISQRGGNTLFTALNHSN